MVLVGDAFVKQMKSIICNIRQGFKCEVINNIINYYKFKIVTWLLGATWLEDVKPKGCIGESLWSLDASIGYMKW